MTKSPLASLPILLAAALLLATGCSSARPTTAAPEAQQDARPLSEDTRAQEEACVDKWLSERGLDQYGSPEGTMYAGGTPLFNEQTGQVQSRLAHVYTKHPAAREACAAR